MIEFDRHRARRKVENSAIDSLMSAGVLNDWTQSDAGDGVWFLDDDCYEPIWADEFCMDWLDGGPFCADSV